MVSNYHLCKCGFWNVILNTISLFLKKLKVVKISVVACPPLFHPFAKKIEKAGLSTRTQNI